MAKKAKGKTAAKKPLSKKKTVAARPPTKKPAKAEAASGGAKGKAKAKAKAKTMDRKSMKEFREMLLRLRERVTGQINSHSDDSLKQQDDASTEDRTDDFDREFALNLVSSEHDALFEIDSALRRIEEGVYGICVSCNSPIERVRLQALPFAHMCVRCQSATERGRSRFRPFGNR